MKRSRNTSAVSLLLCLLGGAICVAASKAATMVWMPAQRIEGDADVRTQGTLVGAYAFGGTTGAGTTNVTVNGVPFVMALPNSAQGVISSSGAQYAYSGFGSTSSPFAGLSSPYRSLLSKGIYGGGNAMNFTVSGSAGQTYLLQFWVNDSRGNTNSTNRNGLIFTVGSNESPVAYSRQKVLTPGSLGDSVSGYLTLGAGETNATINLSGFAGGATLLNAMQVRTASAGKLSWMAEEKYGIMLHYMAGGVLPPARGPAPGYSISAEIPAGKTTSPWSDAMDAFDADAFAEQVSKTGAGYVIFAIGQTSGYYCSPNSHYENIGGLNPGEFTSVRDVISDAADALAKKGIKLIAYLAAEGPTKATTIRRATNQVKMQELSYAVAGPNTPGWAPAAHPTLRANVNAMVSEWSQRWGSRVHGWWFDGCYADTGYGTNAENGDGPGNLAALVAAAKSGNPDSLVALNPGADTPKTGNYGVVSATQDYMAGEAASHSNSYAKFSRYPTSQYVQLGGKNILWHTLSYIGMNWREPRQKYVNEELISYISAVNRVGGAVTLDVAFEPNGQIVEAHFKQLEAIKAAIKPKFPPSVAPQTPPDFVNLALFKPGFSRSNNPESMFLQPSGGQYTAHAAVDGDLATRAQAGGQYSWNFTVDLEAVKDFDRVAVDFSADAPTTTYEIRYSTTGYTGTAGNWQLLNTTESSYSGISAGTRVFNTDGMKTGRFLKIKATTADYQPQMAIGEFEVFNIGGPASTSAETVWVDDKYPAGSTPTSGGFGSSWRWASVLDTDWSTLGVPYPKPGLKLHWSPSAIGWNEHGFSGAQGALKVGTGDNLYCDVWIDPTDLTGEVMLTWQTSTGSTSRAFWGSDLISGGTLGTNSKRYIGPLPAKRGEWIRLALPASVVGLEGTKLTGMSCAVFNGTVYFDRAGRTTEAVYSSSAPVRLAATPGNAQVTLEWNPVVGATSYNVYCGLSQGGPYVLQAAGVTDTSHVDSSLTNGTRYYYVVTAMVNSIEGPNSPEANAKPAP